MKILVAVKRVIDHNIRARATADAKGVDTSGVKMSINPFDEHAVEAAVRLKEAGHASEIIALTVGTAAYQDVLRHALAMGADRAILIETSETFSNLAQAKLLQNIAQTEAVDLILIGKQAIDDDAAEVGQMLAARLGIAQGTFVSEITVNADKTLTVEREIDGGRETIKVSLPAVITTDLRLNEPRYLKLPNLMQAKKKPLETISASSLGNSSPSTLTTLRVEEPRARAPGTMVHSVTELIEKLRNEAGVL
jgi:electron transfer flavoprotein beta subunit